MGRSSTSGRRCRSAAAARRRLDEAGFSFDFAGGGRATVCRRQIVQATGVVRLFDWLQLSMAALRSASGAKKMSKLKWKP
jgi:hypothetical protein